MMLLLARQQDYLACTREEIMVEEVAIISLFGV